MPWKETITDTHIKSNHDPKIIKNSNHDPKILNKIFKVFIRLIVVNSILKRDNLLIYCKWILNLKF